MKNNYIENIIIENTNDFTCILIKPISIENIPWKELDYPKQIASLPTYELVNINKDNFIDKLTTKLDIKTFNIPNLSITNQIISEMPDYVYELLYIDLNDNTEYQNDFNFNGVATLLNTDGNKIYSNALIFKNSLSENSTKFIDANINDIQTILHYRVNTKIVTWNSDTGWKEIELNGNLIDYAKLFFEGYNYKKIELGFLMHNINIWYIDDKYGETNICGSLIREPLDKCIWYTLITDDIRGNLSLDEVKKIIYLSTKLESFNIPKEFNEDQYDKFGKKIIYNKYKILNSVYKNN